MGTRRSGRCEGSRPAADPTRGGDRARHHPKTSYRHDLTSLRVEGYGPFPYQVDGDYLGETEHLDIRHEPDVLRLVIP